MSINCAKCHNHPMEKWTNDQYYGMANLFARVRTKNAGGGRERGRVSSRREGRPGPAADRQAAAADAARRRRPMDLERRRTGGSTVADWLVAPKNPYFARAIVNRVWANFMGVGLVETVDDMRETNPASNEKLMAALATYLVEQKFDLKALMRLILQSEAYQRSSQPLPENETDTRFYSRYYPERLMAEVLLDALSQVTGAPTQFEDYPPGCGRFSCRTRTSSRYFLKPFGRPERTAPASASGPRSRAWPRSCTSPTATRSTRSWPKQGTASSSCSSGQEPDEKIVEEAYPRGLGADADGGGEGGSWWCCSRKRRRRRSERRSRICSGAS